jgi:hypothetical protein
LRKNLDNRFFYFWLIKGDETLFFDPGFNKRSAVGALLRVKMDESLTKWA